MPWDRSKFLVFFLDNSHRDSFAFLPDIYCASILAFRSKETHIHHLQPQPYENAHQQHGRYRIEHPGSKIYAGTVGEASENKYKTLNDYRYDIIPMKTFCRNLEKKNMSLKLSSKDLEKKMLTRNNRECCDYWYNFPSSHKYRSFVTYTDAENTIVWKLVLFTICTYFSKKPFNVRLVPLPTMVPMPPRLEA